MNKQCNCSEPGYACVHRRRQRQEVLASLLWRSSRSSKLYDCTQTNFKYYCWHGCCCVCGLGSNPRVDAICGLSLLLVLVPAPMFFLPGSLVFFPPQHPTFLQPALFQNKCEFHFDLETVDKKPLCGSYPIANSHYLFYIFYYLKIILKNSYLTTGDITDSSLSCFMCRRFLW